MALTILYILFLAISVAPLCLFIELAMSPGMILESYRLWLIKVGKVVTDDKGDIIGSAWYFNPLGGCLYCFSFWVAFFFYVGFYFLICVNPIVWAFLFFPYQGLTYLFIRIFERLE